MTPRDIPSNWNRHPDAPGDTPRPDTPLAPPKHELVTPELIPKEVERPDVSAAGEDGLTSEEDLALMQPPKLGAEAINFAALEASEQEPADVPEETAGRDTPPSGQPPDLPADKTPSADDGSGGDGPRDTPPGDTEGEEPQKAITQVLERSVHDAMQVRERLMQTDTLPSSEQVREINNAFLELAQTTKDVDAINGYLDQMILPTPEERVQGLLVRDEAGDEEAIGDLHDRLFDESQASFAAMEQEGRRTPLPHLDAVLRAYEKQERPVDEFIDTVAMAAPNPVARDAERQHQFLKHASRVLPGSDSEYARAIEPEVNGIAATLSEPRLLEDGPYALLATTDENVGTALFDRFSEKCLGLEAMNQVQEGHIREIQPIFDVAADLPKSAWFTPSKVNELQLILRANIQTLRHTDHNPHRSAHYGFADTDDPEREKLLRQCAEAEVILTIHTLEMPNTMQAAHKTGSLAHPGGIIAPEELDKKCVQEYLRMGYPIGARRFIQESLQRSGILDVSYEEAARILRAHRQTMYASWEAAKTPQQLNQLRPSVLMKELYSASEREYEYMRILRSEEKGWITGYAKELADGTLSVPGLGTNEHAAGALAERLAELDQKAGQDFAYQLLQTIHSQSSDPDIASLRPLYRVLGASDNPDHLNLVRQSARIAEGSDASTLNELAKLARAIKTRITSDRRN